MSTGATPAPRFSLESGGRAARLEQMRRDHPELYAARHVVTAVLQVVVGFVGISALLQVLLPRLSLSAWPFPDLDLPALPFPDIDLPSIPLPAVDLPDLALLDRSKRSGAP